MEHTSGHALMEFNTFTGNASLIRITNVCPAAMLLAFRIAISLRVMSFPSALTRHGPDASQNATPNLIPGTPLTMTSYKSSAVLIKWVWPIMILAPSGISITTVLIFIIANHKNLDLVRVQILSGYPLNVFLVNGLYVSYIGFEIVQRQFFVFNIDLLPYDTGAGREPKDKLVREGFFCLR